MRRILTTLRDIFIRDGAGDYLFKEKKNTPDETNFNAIKTNSTTESPQKQRRNSTTSEAPSSTSPNRVLTEILPTTTTRPEFVHMPTVKFNFGTSSFGIKESKKKTGTKKYIFKKGIKESNEDSARPNKNDIPKENGVIQLKQKERDSIQNKIGSRPTMNMIFEKPKHSSKARFNDKDDTMFSSQPSTNR